MATETTIDPLTQIGGEADLYSVDVEKIFNKAYEKALPEAPKAREPEHVPASIEATAPVVTEVTPAVVEEKKEEAKTPATEPVVAAMKEAATPPVAETTPPVTPSVDPNAWIEKLPEDLRAQAKQVLEQNSTLKHQFESERQRVIALNKKSMNYSNLERELAALRNQIQKPQDPQLAAQVVKDSAKSSAEWEQLINADPTLAKAIESRAKDIVEARLNAAIGQFDTLAQQRASQAVAPLHERQNNAHRDEEVGLLLKEVPNALDVFASKQYKYWFDTYAAPGIKSVATSSVDHRDALEVLNVYSRDLPKVIQDLVASGEMEAPPVQAAPAPVQKEAPVADTSKADQVAKQREQKLTQAPAVTQAPVTVVPTTLAGVGASVDLDDPGVAALFEQAFKKNLRQR